MNGATEPAALRAAATAASADGAAGAVDAQHPWLGLASFTEETRSYFYGRDDEVAELARRVRRKLLTILFGQSGLGKTSILRAGIVPRLRPEGYCPVYVRIDYSQDAPEPAEQIKQAIFRETQASGEWTQSGVAATGESLWEFLHHRDDMLRDADGKTLIPLLIFDQFEEIFTLAQSDAFGRKRAAQFLDDLADLVENRAPKALEARIEQDDAAAEKFDFARADYRILIALREDYLANLEGLKGAMPSITQNRMRLARMTGAQALSAVVKPGGALVTEEVAESIVRFVAGGAELANAEVEPSLLSLICRELNNARITQNRSEISADLLAGSRETILTEFYERALADQPAGVRKVIEDNLLTESGYRESLAEERLLKAFASAGAAPGTLATLVDRRLLRIEERLDVRRVELTHDVLTGVVKGSRDLRLERLARDEAELRLANQRERERATRQALVRARKIASVCAVLAVVAVAASIFGYFSMKRAQEAEAQADSTRKLAETARGESEKLVVYLLDDFYDELEPVGRLDIVGSLAQRAVAYYDALPPTLRTPETERNRALALVRYAAVLRTQGNFKEGTAAAGEAVKVLTRLREGGDQSQAAAIGLALGLDVQTKLASSAGQDDDGLKISQQAVAVIKPLATAPDASPAVRRTYAKLLIANGFELLRNGKNEESLPVLEVAKSVAKGIDDLRMTDLAAAVAYAEATAWQVQALSALGRTNDALAAGKQGIAVASQVLEKQAGNLQALRASALIASPLAGLLGDDMRATEAVAMADKSIATWTRYLSIDPGNTISWGNLAVGYSIKNSILQDLGQPDEAAASTQQLMTINSKAPPSTSLYSMTGLMAGRLAVLEATRGNRSQAVAALATEKQISEWLDRHYDQGSLQHSFYANTPLIWDAVFPYYTRDYQRAIDLTRIAISRFELLKSTDDQWSRNLAFVLRVLHLNEAQAAFELHDYALAASEMDKTLALRRKYPVITLGDKRDARFDESFAALTFARAGRLPEARELITTVLQFEREISPRGLKLPGQRYELAVALYVASVAGIGDAQAQLAEAAALMDKLPPAMRALTDVALWRTRIAEQAGHRRAA
jgi:tetratricopeptide (TPR) repeat protein